MTGNGATESVEIERKYEVAAAAQLPDATVFAAHGFQVQHLETRELSASYFDTSARDLGRAGIAVRRRTGGPDAGWHLKQRGAEGVRELHWAESTEMPAGLLTELTQLLPELFPRGSASVASLRVSATLATTRKVMNICDDSGNGLVEVVDDSVFATEEQLDHRVDAPDRPVIERAWREWEAELLPGASVAVLDSLEPLLLAAGARPSLSSAKIARASGRLLDLALARQAEAQEVAALSVMDTADRLTALLDPRTVHAEAGHSAPAAAKVSLELLGELREIVERLQTRQQ